MKATKIVTGFVIASTLLVALTSCTKYSEEEEAGQGFDDLNESLEYPAEDDGEPSEDMEQEDEWE